MDKAKVLGENKIPSLLWQFSLPAIGGNLVNVLYNIVDSIFVGHGVGEIGLTAVTIAFPLMSLLMAIGLLVGVGASTLVSIRLGEQNKDAADLILGNAVTMLLVFVIISTGAALLFLDPLLIKLGATPEVLPYTHDFVVVILWGSVFLHLGGGLGGVVQAQGDPKMALIAMLISGVLNTILNPILIVGLNLGIKGSAWATVIAQAASAICILVYFIRGMGTLKLKLRNLVLQYRIVIDIIKIGLSLFLMQVSNSVVMFLFNNSLIVYGGELAVASFGIINRMMMLVMMPVMGLTQAAQPIIGYNFGAKQFDRVLETLKIVLTLAVCAGAVGVVIIYMLATPIIHLFNGGEEMVAIGSVGLKVFLVMMPLIGFQVIGASYFQAVGKAGYTIVLNLLRQVILLIPLVIILPMTFGLMGIWAAGPISDFVSALLTSVFLYREMRKLSSENRVVCQENIT
ncbi:MAG: mepA 2 [Firmicutes bacterium]|nr:mepA 2 [Bacillota bacterium]